MVLPISGPLRFSQIQSEFNQTGDFILSDHYRGGGIVPSTSGVAGGVAEVQSVDFSGATSNTLTAGQDELVSITLDNRFDSGFTENFSVTVTTSEFEPALTNRIFIDENLINEGVLSCLLYTSPSPRDS